MGGTWGRAMKLWGVASGKCGVSEPRRSRLMRVREEAKCKLYGRAGLGGAELDWGWSLGAGRGHSRGCEL